METELEGLFWAHIGRRLGTEDDLNLWQLALPAIISDIDCEQTWESIRPLHRVHLVIASQSHWWRPHGERPHPYGGALNGLGALATPDWELHWYRDRRSGLWEYRGKSAGKQKGSTSHCLTFFPGRTKRHRKASVVQIWKSSTSAGLPITRRRPHDNSFYWNGRRYLFLKGKGGDWEMA